MTKRLSDSPASRADEQSAKRTIAAPSAAYQTSDRFNENPEVGTAGIRGTYDVLAGRFENDTHNQYPQLPRVMTGVVAGLPERD